jgi:SH3-like domain-containing protein
MRSGPGTGHEVLWVLNKGYPLKVLRRQGRWLEVQDFENDKGWVARALTGRTPHHVVKSRIVNIRKGPGTGYPIIGQAEYGEVLRTRSKRRDWVQVERAEGQPGWVAKRLLWGW